MSREPLVLLSVALVCCLLSSAPARGWDIYLEGYHGPYRGRVVDAETKEPIVGAVVAAVWRRDKIYPLHSTSAFHGAREVLTVADGTFVVDGADLERGAPAQTLKPYFHVFAPGFASYRSQIFMDRGFEHGTVFGQSGTTIGLPRLKTRQERLATIAGGVMPYVPEGMLPGFRRLIDVERTALGLVPLQAPKEK